MTIMLELIESSAIPWGLTLAMALGQLISLASC